MKKEKAENLIGKTVIHEKYGEVLIMDFIDLEKDKFIGYVVNEEVEKSFILSGDYFSGANGEKFARKNLKPKPKRTYKKPDEDKFRKNPFLKELDKKDKYKPSKLYDTAIDEDNEDLDEDNDN